MKQVRHLYRLGQHVTLNTCWPGPRPGTLPPSIPWEYWPEGTALRVTKIGTTNYPRYQVTDGTTARWVDEEIVSDSQQTLPFPTTTDSQNEENRTP